MHGLFPPTVSVHRSLDDGAAVAALADVPRARGMVLAVVGRGPAPGFGPRPATVQAFAAAARMRSVPQRWCSFGRPAEAEIVRVLADERVPTLDDRDPRTLVCRWPGVAHTITIPRGWIGRHLCLVVPCVSASAPRRGPVAAALAAVADAVGAGDADEPCEVGARIVAGTFAGITLVVDAHVAVVRARPGAGRPRLVPAHRLFTAHRVPAPASWLLALAHGFDGWLRHRTPSAQLRFAGPAADTPWTRAVGEPIGANGPLWPEVPPRRRGAPATRV